MKKTKSSRTRINTRYKSLDKTQKISKHSESGFLRKILIVALIISIGILIGVVSFTIYRIDIHKTYSDKVVEYHDIDASVIVTSGSVGLNGDTDSLKFGKISQGGGGTRFVTVNTTQNVSIEIYFSGDIAKFLSVEKNGYSIEKGIFEKVPINIDIPSNTPIGEYSGKVHIVLLRQ